MHDLITIEPSMLGELTVAEIDQTIRYASAEKAASTREAYASDWRDFAAWCAGKGATPLPAHPGMVAAYLSTLAEAGLKASTIGRRAAAIAHRHKLAGLEPPTSAEGVRATLRGIRRTLGAGKAGKAPATGDIVRRMLECCDGSLKGKRDRALLSLGLAGAFRRSELCALKVEDLQEVADGLLVTIRRSKTDQAGEGVLIGILRGTKIRPVQLVREWLDAAGITEGYVLRAVLKGGRVQPGGLTPQVIASVVKEYAAKIGLDPRLYAGHSLRAGMITSGAEAGAGLWKLMELSRHRSVQVLQTYVRAVDLWKDHAGAGVL